MGRGLSQQQRDILDLLPWHSEAPEAKDTPSTREIIGLLGLTYTPSNRASVSRAISRLGQRGLVLHRWGFKQGYGHTGYARATPVKHPASVPWATYCEMRAFDTPRRCASVVAFTCTPQSPMVFW